MSDNITSNSLLRALTSEDSSVRFNAAMAAGTHPNSEYIETLVSRCALEPDFFVRDMLTWALISQDRSVVTPRIIKELSSSMTQARSQALHTLSKIADPATWPVITEQLLLDKEDEVARATWRVAVILAPEAERRALAELLVTQLNRGDNAVKLSLSRALVDLGEFAIDALQKAAKSSNEEVRAHAVATQKLAKDPEFGFEAALDDARRRASLTNAPMVDPKLLD